MGESVKATLEGRAARAFWLEYLRELPSIFARLVFVSSLRDFATGRYRLPQLAARFGQTEINDALRATHEQVFQEWIEFRLVEQHADLRLYLAIMSEQPGLVVCEWQQQVWYRRLLPDRALEADRANFLIHAELLLKLLCEELA